jgi:hypothetical protein
LRKGAGYPDLEIATPISQALIESTLTAGKARDRGVGSEIIQICRVKHVGNIEVEENKELVLAQNSSKRQN